MAKELLPELKAAPKENGQPQMQPQFLDLNTLSIGELKIFVYDSQVEGARIQNNITLANQLIAQKSREKNQNPSS
jgi:hypothetical protein